MELAIPLIALGGMYVISNQKNKNCNAENNIDNINNVNSQHINKNNQTSTENFTNMGMSSNYLPNTNIQPQNYPVTNKNQLINNTSKYPNPNAATDKYFDQNLYQQKVNHGISVEQNPQQIYSLTGDYLNSDQFKHNNMVPFNGGKVKGYTYNTNMTESVLDNMVGSGSQTIKKIEQAPLFKPEENMSWTYGMPNNTEFYLSRVNPGMRINNTLPFEREQVAKGLDQGFTTMGSGGFNSGMEARDKWLPPTVDQLRVATNPKLEYELINHEGPAQSMIKNIGVLGKVEKQRPDTFFINTQDRWLTTTGSEKASTLRSIQELGVIRRPDCADDYMGPAGNSDRQAPYAPTSFEQSKRNELDPFHVSHSSAQRRGPYNDKDNFMKSHTNYENHRSTVIQPDTMRSGFSGAIGAVVAPLLDILRPSRKEETINNVRVYGEAGTAVPSSYVYNSNDKTNTTVKETTIYSPNFYINNQKESMYVNNYSAPDMTQRDSTSVSYNGPSGGFATQSGNMLYDSAYRQTNNDIKSATISNRANQGNMGLFNGNLNVNCQKQDTTRYDCRVNPAGSVIPMPASVEIHGKLNIPESKNIPINGCERIDPNLLNAFRNNPYTHSLSSAV